MKVMGRAVYRRDDRHQTAQLLEAETLEVPDALVLGMAAQAVRDTLHGAQRETLDQAIRRAADDGKLILYGP